MSYTQANEQSWMDRLPRIQSRSKSQMSAQSFDDEKGDAGYLQPGTFLRRQKEEDNPSRAQSRASSRRRSRHSKSKSLTGMFGPGGPISQSAIEPSRRDESPEHGFNRSDSDTLAVKSDPPSDDKPSPAEDASGSDLERKDSPGEIYEEGQETVYEDEEGNVLEVEPSRGEHGKKRQEHELHEGRRLMHKEGADKNHGVAPTHDDPNTDPGHEAVHEMETGEGKVFGEPDSKAKQRPGKGWREGWNKMSKMSTTAIRGRDTTIKAKKEPENKETRGPARAYQYGNTIIVEDEDGEVIRKYDIPAPDRKQSTAEHPSKTNERIGKMGKMLGLSSKEARATAGASGPDPHDGEPGSADSKQSAMKPLEEDDNRVRFVTQGGRRMSKAEFISQIRSMDPKSRVEAVEDSDVPEAVKREARKESRDQAMGPAQPRGRGQSIQVNAVPTVAERPEAESKAEKGGEAVRPAQVERAATSESADLKLVTSQDEEVPVHDVSSDLRDRRTQRQSEGDGDKTETAAERRRRLAAARPVEDSDSEDDGTDRVPPARRPGASSNSPPAQADRNTTDTGETAAERRRREGALGIAGKDDSDSEDDDQPREAPQPRSNIRFADQSTAQQQPQRRLRWGKDVRQ